MALSWTYTADFASTEPGYSTGSTVGVRDQIRFLVQDTTSTRQLLFDQEIDWAQTQEANAYTAAARCCETLVTRAGGQKSKKVGSLSITYDPSFYRALAMDLRSRGMTYQLPYAGGISIADKIAQESDPDWVKPRMTITEFDNPGAEQPGSDTTSKFWPSN